MYLCVRCTKPGTTLYWSACNKPGKWTVMYLCVRCIKPGKWMVMYLCVRRVDFTSFYDFDIWFWNCSVGVTFFTFYFITSLKVTPAIKREWSHFKQDIHPWNYSFSARSFTSLELSITHGIVLIVWYTCFSFYFIYFSFMH